jgi:hypothetical protein
MSWIIDLFCVLFPALVFDCSIFSLALNYTCDVKGTCARVHAWCLADFHDTTGSLAKAFTTNCRRDIRLSFLRLLNRNRYSERIVFVHCKACLAILHCFLRSF